MAHHLGFASLAALVLVLTVPACENPDSSAVLAVQATGVVGGLVFFDANGDGQPTAPADTGLVGVRVRLVVPGGTIPVATAVSATGGGFRMAPIPVGRYGVVVDTATVPVGMQVASLDSTTVVASGDSVAVRVAMELVPVIMHRP